ncbi:MAG TPA: TetR/AcrR family transcriptional regulator [Burkholderiaceae bacterium]|nr:TetR/AcrR family transcriptional regulator [Burkholderiaceae bacterium]
MRGDDPVAGTSVRPQRGAGAPARGRALGTDDWLAAANALLASDNIHGVQISALCQKLGVTKGSFYWHFRNRAGLLRAMLDDWRRRMTLGVVSRLTRTAIDAATRLRELLSLPRRGFSVPATAVEMSVREWGRRDAATRGAVQEVDLIRLKFFEQCFAELGFAPAQARTRAYLAYALMMGDSVLRDTLGEQVDDEALVETACALLATEAPNETPPRAPA